MVKRKKLPSIKALRNKLDKIFNAYIRTRDGACILSGETTGLVCSHYYGKRAAPFLRWDERNAHAMSKKMHWLHHHGREADYALWMFEHNSKIYMRKLALDSKKQAKYTRDIYLQLVEKYQKKLKKIENRL